MLLLRASFEGFLPVAGKSKEAGDRRFEKRSEDREDGHGVATERVTWAN